ncbi:hypothetical protein RB195_024838 [Necator americanus]|uniref:Uncharacterized protein n=1 Tax=Necator americanus TaxID=51031 RepID=A0ABR1EPV9_NECAM
MDERGLVIIGSPRYACFGLPTASFAGTYLAADNRLQYSALNSCAKQAIKECIQWEIRKRRYQVDMPQGTQTRLDEATIPWDAETQTTILDALLAIEERLQQPGGGVWINVVKKYIYTIAGSQRTQTPNRKSSRTYEDRRGPQQGRVL